MSYPNGTVLLRFIVLAVWGLTIGWLSLTAQPPAPNVEMLGYDKLLHASAYFTLTMLAGWAFSGITTLTSRLWLMLAVSAMLIGGVMEGAQALFTSTRTAEMYDMAANGFGAGAALLLARLLRCSNNPKNT